MKQEKNVGQWLSSNGVELRVWLKKVPFIKDLCLVTWEI